MVEQGQINEVKKVVEEFFGKMTIEASSIEVSLSSAKKGSRGGQDSPEEDIDVIDLDIKLEEPQILIGQGGQTLFEIQRMLRVILNRKLSRSQSDRGSPDSIVDPRLRRDSAESGQNTFYLNLDINDYKKKKIEYLKDLAKNLADQASLDKEEKSLLPMSAYERRIIHSELSQRTDVTTESQGDGFERHIVIKPE